MTLRQQRKHDLVGNVVMIVMSSLTIASIVALIVTVALRGL